LVFERKTFTTQKVMTNSVAEFESQVLANIDKGNLDSALNSIINFADEIAYGYLSILARTNVYGSKDLDKLCQTIGHENLNQNRRIKHLESDLSKTDENLSVYIASHLYQAGGHTAVINDIIKSRPDKKHLILITNTFNLTDRLSVDDRFRALNVQIIFAPSSRYIDKLNWLQQALDIYRAKQVFLFNHPHDAIAVAAVQPNLTPNLIFYHHSAHIFSLGVYIPYAQHIDCDSMGFYNCRNHLGISNNSYLPLIVDNVLDRSLSYSPSDRFITCCSGNESKFINTPYLYSYIDEVPKIINTTNGIHVHIGNLSEQVIANIKTRLQSLDIDFERFIYIPWVSSLGMAMNEYNVDIYLDSFPIGGTKAVIEVMASGTPILGHTNYCSRQLSPVDIIYPEAFKWKKLEDLYNYLKNVNAEMLKFESTYARKHYENNHTLEILKECLLNLEHGKSADLPPKLRDYERDDLQSLLDRFFALKHAKNTFDVYSQTKWDLPREDSGYSQLASKSISVTKPLVSICIPTYNGERFIREAIDSILSQTYPNLEIIISDDNSNDKTVEIAKSFQESSNCVFSILKHEQYGLSQNWNFCISQANGKYIKFVFQDDLLEPTAIAEMVELAEQDNEIGLVFSPRKLFTTPGDDYYDPSFLESHGAKDIHRGWSNLQPIQSGQELLRDPNIFNYSINKIGEPTTVLIKKEMFDRVGLFNPELCQLVDLEMWLRIISECKVGFVDRYLSHFRLHEQQQTNQNSKKAGIISLDFSRFFHIIYSDLRYPKNTRENAYYLYVIQSEQRDEFSQVRMQFARDLLAISDDRLEDVYASILSVNHQMLVARGSNFTSFTEPEQLFVNELMTTLERGLNQPKAIQHLLVAMLYCPFDRLPLKYADLCDLPNWFLRYYLEFIFTDSVSFHELGGTSNYYRYIQGWMNYLHTSIFDNLDDPFWQEVASQFAQFTNFILTYFNEENLNDIYVKRAEIIELFLRNNGCEVDYEFSDRPLNRKKIRLGILASHFTPSAETFASLPTYEYLSREFEVILYSLHQTNHPLEHYCRSSANYFTSIPQDLSQQVETIRADDLDLLFVATNVTAVTNQIGLLATHRLARIQLTSGGSVVTTGIKNMDYFLSGTFTDPSSLAQEQYREKLLQIAGAAHCFSYGDDETQANFEIDREILDISKDAVIFTSGANFFKITAELIHSWAKIIAEVPNSVLMLLPFGPNWSRNYPKGSLKKRLDRVFNQYGISLDRLIVLDPRPIPNRADIKEYCKCADVYLDSYPFAGTTSLIEPLQVNLPVIARKGNSFRSAMGAAMIQSLDIPGLVADSEESYIQLAIELGNNPELRQQKRNEIELKMRNNPSFLDSRGYSAKIGDMFRKLFDDYNQERLNQNLRLSDVNLMVFPDWNQSEESVGLELQQVIQALATQSGDRQTTLLIDTTNIAIEDAEMFISSVAMNLMMEEDIDITEELEISLIEDLSDIQWETLMPRINARIVLECDNQASIGKLSLTELSQLDLESFMRSNQVLSAN
jgi:predicted O-linked N-acetylglucosamine transferase (SPINDLY family)